MGDSIAAGSSKRPRLDVTKLSVRGNEKLSHNTSDAERLAMTHHCLSKVLMERDQTTAAGQAAHVHVVSDCPALRRYSALSLLTYQHDTSLNVFKKNDMIIIHFQQVIRHNT